LITELMIELALAISPPCEAGQLARTEYEDTVLALFAANFV